MRNIKKIPKLLEKHVDPPVGWRVVGLVMSTTTETQSLADRFEMRAESFKRDMNRIAAGAKLPVLDVFMLWLEYCETCQNYDQSPVMIEFLQWYAPFFTPTREELES